METVVVLGGTSTVRKGYGVEVEREIYGFPHHFPSYDLLLVSE